MSQESVNINKKGKVSAAKRLLKILETAHTVKTKNDKELIKEHIKKKYT